MLRAVIFDLDDTLVDQATAAAAAVTAWAAEHGVTHQEIPQRWARISEANYARYQRRELTFAEQRRERTREFLGVQVDDASADELFAGYLVRYEAAWATFDDAIPTLRRVKAAGLAVAVLTNGDETHQRSKLNKLGLTANVDYLIASSMLPVGKPDPRAFMHALEHIGVAADDALMVGDSLEKDVRGALAVGLGAVLLDRHDAYPDVDVNRIRTLDDLSLEALAAG